MPAITEVRTATVEIPLTTVFSTSNKTTTAARLLLVNVRTDDGAEGWGEAQLNPTFTDETPASARAAVDAIAAERLKGQDADAVFAALPELGRRLSGRIAARCALSIALWDLRARLLGVPLHDLLGGARRRQVPVAYHLGHFDEHRDAADARTAVEAGFGILKLKVGRSDVAADLRAVERVRETAGAARLYVDANQAWGFAPAAAFTRRAVELGVEVVEQPLPQWDLAGLAELSTTPGVVVAADESVFDAAQLLSTLTAGHRPGGVVVKLLKAGGIDGVQAVLGLAGLGRIAPFLAGMCGDTSIGSAALLHIAAAAGELPLGTAITPHFSRVDLVAEPLTVTDGQVHLDAVDGPGLGVTVDPAQVEKLGIAD
jgi:L-alanine-DL-glutamate epimerase-like enolase superfamily enzyme